MIHLTVGQPMGIDSVFFSFIQRLAIHNGHECIDPPALNIDPADSGAWIDNLRGQSKHIFLIGYRYPPPCWKRLVEVSTSVILLADADGMARHVHHLRHQCVQEGGSPDLRISIEGLSGALDDTIALTQWILSETQSDTHLVLPALAFLEHPNEAFRRLEFFYRSIGVSLATSCSDQFTTEALPLLQDIFRVSKDDLLELQRLLALDSVSLGRLHAISTLFCGYS